MNEVFFAVSKKKPRYRREKINFSAQHLLINKSLIYEMVRLARIGRNDTVIDIGAGTGAITFPLAERAGTVIAIENDPASVRKLRSKMKEKTNIRVKQTDILRYELPVSPFCVVANIPYSITTPIFDKLLGASSPFMQRAVFLIERGAAKRFTADPITDPRILTWRLGFEIRFVRTVPPDNFSPPPGVDSAVVTVCKKHNPEVPIRLRRKFMALASHALRDPWLPFAEAIGEVFTSPQVARLAKELRIERNRPVCTLNERQWGMLFLSMIKHVEPHRWPKPRKS